MAVTYLTLYLAGQALQVVEGSQLHFIYASMGATAQPPTPEPYTRPDPFPQYVHDDEIGALLAGAAVPATDPVVASLVSNSSSATSGALRTASEAVAADVSEPKLVGGKRAVRKDDLALDLRDFGGKNDGGVTDNSVALAAALDALPAAGGGSIYLPAGRDWHFASRVDITKPVRLFGDGGGGAQNDAGTRLVFAAGQGGLDVNIGGIFAAEGLALVSLSTAFGAGQHGIRVRRGRAQLSGVTVELFGEHGIFFDSTNSTGQTPPKNVNHSVGISVRAYGNRGDGIRLEGSDSNVVTLISPDVVANYGWGINNIGNHNIFIAPHADQQYNGSPGAYRDDALSSHWQHVYAEGLGIFLIDTNSRSGAFSDSQFGAVTLNTNGVGHTTWEIVRSDGVRSTMRLKATTAGAHEYRLAESTNVGRLDLADVTRGGFVFTVTEDGSVMYFYMPLSPVGDGGSDLGTVGNRWRDLLLSRDLKVGGKAGFNGATPQAKAANPGTATGTDAAVINAVVTALRNMGIVT